ncbi:hypothetical protein ACJBU6_06638 [Exserohilum turcicum]
MHIIIAGRSSSSSSNSGSRIARPHRPSTRDGQRINPEIIIEFGSKKGKGGKYSSVSFSTKNQKHPSLGSLGSNDAAVDFADSEASYTLRTGFPEAPLPPPAAYDQPNTFLPTPPMPHGYYSPYTPSASSSQTPSLTIPSEADFDLPATRRATRPSATIIHNPTVGPSSPTKPQQAPSSGSYKVKRIAPRDLPHDDPAPSSLHPLDYDQYADYPNPSRATSGVAETTRPTKNTSERRKKLSEDLSYQDDADRKRTDDAAKAENDKHVRFELGRYEARAKERSERALAEKEKDRATAREAERQRKKAERLEQERKELEEQRAKERKKERSKPPATEHTKRPSNSRRLSSLMTPEEQAEQRRLLEADSLFMQGEKQAAEAREREERRAAARQQQEASTYYDPRGGDRSLSNNNNASTTQRSTMPRHDSFASTTRPSGLSRTSSKRRPSISQPSPPPANTQSSADYSVRSPSTRTRAPPPLSFPKNFNQDHTRPSSSRRASITQDNPFSPTSVTSPTHDPWDVRNGDSAPPPTRPSESSRYQITQPRDDPIVHSPTRSVRRTTDYVSVFDGDDDGVEEYPPVYASRLGLSRSGSRRKH